MPELSNSGTVDEADKRSIYRYKNEDHPYTTPGIFFEEAAPRKVAEFRTGVPVFLGFSRATHLTELLGTGKPFHPYILTGWRQFAELVGAPAKGSFLGQAVKGFFENGGTCCVVVTLRQDEADAKPTGSSPAETRVALELLTSKALELLESREDVDLVCFPDLACAGEPQTVFALQCKVLEHCRKMGDRFAILDSTSGAGASGGKTHADGIETMVHHWQKLVPTDGALYFPWILARDEATSNHRLVPPCGHIAGIYARTDLQIGVHKAPANEIIEGAIDLQVRLSDQDQSELNKIGVNCLRVLPGRGIRVWGARTLSVLPQWRYVSVRRLFLTLVRWINNAFQDLVFEPQTPLLWDQIRRRLDSFCYNLFQTGALKGVVASQAFYVKCDAETNPPVEQQAGRVISEVGLAPTVPAEFIVVRIAHSAAGITSFTGPTGPEK